MFWLIWLVVGLGLPHVVLLWGWYPPLPPAPPPWQEVSFHSLKIQFVTAFHQLPPTNLGRYAHQLFPTTLALPMAWHHHFSTALAWHSLYHSSPNGMPHHGLLYLLEPLIFCTTAKHTKAPTTAPRSFILKKSIQLMIPQKQGNLPLQTILKTLTHILKTLTHFPLNLNESTNNYDTILKISTHFPLNPTQSTHEPEWDSLNWLITNHSQKHRFLGISGYELSRPSPPLFRWIFSNTIAPLSLCNGLYNYLIQDPPFNSVLWDYQTPYNFCCAQNFTCKTHAPKTVQFDVTPIKLQVHEWSSQPNP